MQLAPAIIGCLYIATRHSTIPQKFTMVNTWILEKCMSPASKCTTNSHTTIVITWSWCCMLWHLCTYTCVHACMHASPPPPPPPTPPHPPPPHTHTHMHTHTNLHACQQHMTFKALLKDAPFELPYRKKTQDCIFCMHETTGQPGSYRPWHVLCNVWLHRPAFLREMRFIANSYIL